MSANLAYENWRYEDRNMTGEERNQGSWGWYNTKLPNGTTYKDAIQFYGGGVLMSHRNEKLDLFNFQVEQQHLSKYKDTLYNPMKDNEVSHDQQCPTRACYCSKPVNSVRSLDLLPGSRNR